MLNSKAIIDKIQQLVIKFEGAQPDDIKMLPPSGSYRQYYRIWVNNKTMLGVYNADIKENAAYLSFTETFKNNGLPVPATLIVDSDTNTYLIEDLGDEMLIDFISNSRAENSLFDIKPIYKKVIDQLVRFQAEGTKDLDFEVCYPRKSFDVQSIQWDLNYFKYNFLKPAKITFDEQLLEDDFKKLTTLLNSIDKSYFMYRDFQSSNIMLVNDEPFFIDFQGGRKGPLQYDIASLLFDAKARIKDNDKLELLDYYVSVLANQYNIVAEGFLRYFYPVVLIRVMQAMGAYGFRGLMEKKASFIKSIPLAINNLKFILKQYNDAENFPELFRVFNRIVDAKNLQYPFEENDKLTVTITSFSYKKGIPDDLSGNGGGFVFDCRGIYNPGREKEFQHLTGKDEAVKTFLNNQLHMKSFLSNVTGIVSISVREYLHRDFKNLMVNFGCTGGQHRSVYAAEFLASYLKKHYDINIRLWHREQETS